MMPRQSPVNARQSPVKTDEKARQSPVKPEDVQWQWRSKKRCRDGSSLRDSERFISYIGDRICELNAKIPMAKAECDDCINEYKFASYEVKHLKKRRRLANEDVIRLEAELKKAKNIIANVDTLTAIARKDREEIMERVDDSRADYLHMVDDRAFCLQMHERALDKLDGTPSRRQILLMSAAMPPITDADTDDDLPDDEVPVPPGLDDHYEPSIPSYKV